MLEEEEEKTLVSHFPPLTPDLGYPAVDTLGHPAAQWDRRIISALLPDHRDVQHPVREDMMRLLEWSGTLNPLTHLLLLRH